MGPPGRFTTKPPPVHALDGRTRVIVAGESLARVIAVIRITSVRWRPYLPPNTEISPHRPCARWCRKWNRAIGVHSCNIRSTWNCGMVCESWPQSLNASDWRSGDLAHLRCVLSQCLKYLPHRALAIVRVTFQMTTTTYVAGSFIRKSRSWSRLSRQIPLDRKKNKTYLQKSRRDVLCRKRVL